MDNLRMETLCIQAGYTPRNGSPDDFSLDRPQLFTTGGEQNI